MLGSYAFSLTLLYVVVNLRKERLCSGWWVRCQTLKGQIVALTDYCGDTEVVP